LVTEVNNYRCTYALKKKETTSLRSSKIFQINSENANGISNFSPNSFFRSLRFSLRRFIVNFAEKIYRNLQNDNEINQFSQQNLQKNRTKERNWRKMNKFRPRDQKMIAE